MGLFSGNRSPAGVPVERDWGVYPVIPPNSMTGMVSASFTQVDTRETESAMRKVAVASATELISSLASQLPLDCYTGDGPSKRQVTPSAFFEDPDGTGHGPEDWLAQLLYSLLLRGNGVGKVLDRDSMGRPSQVLLQHPDTVSVVERADGPQWYFGGRQVPAEQVWHMRAFTVPGRRLGMSPISRHATTIGQGLAAGAFGLRWFLDGAHPSSILQNEDEPEIGVDLAKLVKRRFMAAVRGTREPVVIGKGWKYQQIQVSAEESQFLNTQKYSAAECARIFGPGIAEVLGYETGGSMTYTNVEQRSLDLLKFSLNKWLVRIEKRLSREMLARPRFVKFNRAALLQTDLLTRYQAYDFALRGQWKVINEIRDMEDMSRVPWGDDPLGVVGKASLQVPLEDAASAGTTDSVDGGSTTDTTTTGQG